jgi:hypothetical protein
MNELEKIINNFPDKSWSYTKLSTNPNINTRIIFNLGLDRPWSYYFLSKNEAISLDDAQVLGLCHKWDFEHFEMKENSRNYNRPFPKKYFVDTDNGIETKALRKQTLSSWENFLLATYPDLNFEYFIDLFPNTAPFSWSSLSRNPSINIDMIIKHINKPWIWKYVSENPAITFEDVLNHPELPWRWDYLSMNPNLTLDIIINNIDKNWSFDYMSLNLFDNHFNLFRDFEVFYKLTYIKEKISKLNKLLLEIFPTISEYIIYNIAYFSV